MQLHVIGESEWDEVVTFLFKLDTNEARRLGGVLGLSMFRLEKMKNMPDDLVRAWKRKPDEVNSKCPGPLTWEVLIEALEKIGQNGIAEDIRQGKISALN